MEKFLIPKFENELSKITLEYVYKDGRNLTSLEKGSHALILANWMSHDLIPYDEEVWEYLKNQDILLANMRLAELGGTIFHISNNPDTSFNILYFPEQIEEFQKFRLRIWLEYLEKFNRIYEIGFYNKNVMEWVKNESAYPFLEEQQILDDSYIRILAKKFYPEEYK